MSEKNKMKPLIRDLSIEELEQALVQSGQQKFRAKQVFEWVQKGLGDWDAMANIPKALRESLAGSYDLEAGDIVETLRDPKDDTRKHLIRLRDGQVIETVSMLYQHGHSVCVSTQVGCRMGCWFCASTQGGLIRNLSPGEILTQIFHSARDRGVPVTHVVLMGSGEPLDNLQAVLKFLELVKHPAGLQISHRHITLSTCGIVPKMAELADEHLQITLAVSLHAAEDSLRDRLVPVNRTYPIAALIKASMAYFQETGRRITFEYALLKGVNDTLDQANGLIALLRGLNCHVNLIPANTIQERDFEASQNMTVDRFAKALKKGGISVTVRRELGDSIQAACGQLRQKYMETPD